MNFGRILANAFARRIAFVIVALLFAWMGIGQARAANCELSGDACNQGEATSQAWAKYNASGLPNKNSPTVYSAGPGQVQIQFKWGNTPPGTSVAYTNPPKVYVAPCPAGTEVGPTGGCIVTCNTKPDYTISPSGDQYRPPNGAVTCSGGCAVAFFNNGDGTYTGKPSVLGTSCEILPDCTGLGLTGAGYVFNANAGSCEPPEVECPTNQTKGVDGTCQDACPVGKHLNADGICTADENECPAGNIKSPEGNCLPGEGQCAAGEAKKPDGTCGKDTDGDGEAEDDENTEESFSGGDSCSAPPSCSGGVIDCGMARIQWRIDCNTRKNRNIVGGACGQIPICTGEKCDALEYSSLLMQWRTACATEKLANATGGGTGDSGALDEINAWTKATATPDGGAEGTGTDSWADGEGEEIEPDQSGYGFTRTCPTIPSIDVFGTSITINTGPLCDWAGLGGNIVLIVTALGCARIIAGKAS